MAFYSIPPIVVPRAPEVGAAQVEQSEWQERLVHSVGSISQTLTEFGDAFIAASTQMATGIVNTAILDPGVATDIDHGATAWAGTVNYRATGAPTNVITPDTMVSVVQTDGSVSYVLGWLYTQGATRADFFVIVVARGDVTPDYINDPHFAVRAQSSAAGSFATYLTLTGVSQDETLSFSVGAARRSESGLELGTMTGSLAAPDWKGVTVGTPDYSGTIRGVNKHTFSLSARGSSTAMSSATHAVGFTKDGQALSWTGQDTTMSSPIESNAIAGFDVHIYDLIASASHYAHSFPTRPFRTVSYATSIDALVQDNDSSSGDISSALVSGKFGWGLAYNPGTTTRTLLRSDTASTYFVTGRTYECWFKGTGSGGLVTLSTTSVFSAGLQVFSVNANGTVNTQAIQAAGTTLNITSTGVVNDGNWHLLTSTITNTGLLRLYIDGVKDVDSSATSSLTAFDSRGAPVARYLGVFYRAANFTGAPLLDELSYTNVQLHGEVTSFTASTTEYRPFFLGGTTNSACSLWHFQEGAEPFVNDCRPAAALTQLITTRALLINLFGLSVFDYLFLIRSRFNPTLGRTNDNLALAMATLGAAQGFYSMGAWQEGAAYTLVGHPLAGEGGGMERYNGKTPTDPTAYVSMSFTIDDRNITNLQGKGWFPVDTPGPPTNAPTAGTATVTARDTGTDVLTITWGYTQPAAQGENKLADGFVVYAASGNTATPTVGPAAAYYLDANTLSFTIQAPHNQSWSFAVAPYRKSKTGMEVGASITSAAAPDWQGIGGATVVGSDGIGACAVTSVVIASSSVTTIAIANSAVTSVTIAGSAVTSVTIAASAVTSIKIAGDNVLSTNRQQVNTQTVVSSSIGVTSLGPATSDPVVFKFAGYTFNHSIGRVPTSIVSVDDGVHPVWLNANTTTQILASLTNLFTAGDATTVRVDYW